jgi:hypothetical protein
MKLSTGKVAFRLEFDNGDVGTIYFNPNDRGLQDRIAEFEKNIQEKAKQIDIEKYKTDFENDLDVDVNLEDFESLMSLSPDQIKMLRNRANAINNIEREYNNLVKNELDNVFEGKVSDTAFKYCEPFDVVIIEDEKGNEKTEVYIIHFLHWLSIELRKHAENNNAAMNKHIGKYTK